MAQLLMASCWGVPGQPHAVQGCVSERKTCAKCVARVCVATPMGLVKRGTHTGTYSTLMWTTWCQKLLSVTFQFITFYMGLSVGPWMIDLWVIVRASVYLCSCDPVTPNEMRECIFSVACIFGLQECDCLNLCTRKGKIACVLHIANPHWDSLASSKTHSAVKGLICFSLLSDIKWK